MKNVYQIDQNGQNEPKLTKVNTVNENRPKYAKMNTISKNGEYPIFQNALRSTQLTKIIQIIQNPVS